MSRTARHVSCLLLVPLGLVLVANCASDPDAGRLTPTEPGPDLTVDPGLIGPALTLTPDFRPLSGSPAATLDQPPIQDPYFDPMQRWAGAVPPATPARGNIPWYTGWTVGW